MRDYQRFLKQYHKFYYDNDVRAGVPDAYYDKLPRPEDLPKTPPEDAWELAELNRKLEDVLDLFQNVVFTTELTLDTLDVVLSAFDF